MLVRVVRLALIAALLGLVGCASPARERTARPAPDALLGMGGSPLVFAAPGLSYTPAGPIDASLGGRAVPAWVDHVVLVPTAAAGDRWREAPPTWESAPPGAPGALTFVHVEIPADAHDAELLVGSERRALRVLKPEAPGSPPAPPGEASLHHADDVSTNDYWRLRLMGIAAGGLSDRHPAERAGALALRAQWNVALSRLEDASPWLGGRVMLALTRTCDVGETRALAWTDDPASDDRLRRALLDDRLTTHELSETARAWLDAQATMTARVRDPASAGVPAVQLTDLSGRPARASISDGRRNGVALLAPAWGSVELPAPSSESTRDLLIVNAGPRAIELTPPSSSILAQPPGARLGPLLPDLSMREWILGAAAPNDRSAASAALLQRRAHANEWELYVECKSPGSDAPDSVRVWLGPRGGSVETLSLDRSGSLVSNRPGSSAELITHEVREDRWSATLAVPASAITPDGTLLIGLTRELGEGEGRRRWAWPVALLPWEEDPGRVSVSLTDWYRLSR